MQALLNKCAKLDGAVWLRMTSSEGTKDFLSNIFLCTQLPASPFEG